MLLVLPIDGCERFGAFSSLIALELEDDSHRLRFAKDLVEDSIVGSLANSRSSYPTWDLHLFHLELGLPASLV